MSDVHDVASQANAAWDLFEFVRATELFDLGASMESESAAKRPPFALPDQRFGYRLRAAFCRWDSGSFENARKTLLDALTFDWKQSRLWGEWHDDDVDEDTTPAPRVVSAGQGSYEAYLESRLPDLVRGSPHWCAKGLTEVELEPLAEAATLGRAVGEDALFCPPQGNAQLREIRSELVSKLAALDDHALQTVADQWAAIMSGPKHTHSVSGKKLNDGWTSADAMSFLRSIVLLSRRAKAPHEMFLLIEW